MAGKSKKSKSKRNKHQRKKQMKLVKEQDFNKRLEDFNSNIKQ